jgi:hypothetical protein
MPRPSKVVALSLLAASAAVAPGKPALARTPLFAAFRTFCLATGARPKAVSAAVVRADPVAAGQGDVERQAAYMSIAWRPVFRHARLRVSLAMVRDSHEHPNWPPWTMVACTVIGEADAGRSIAPFRSELGLPADPHPTAAAARHVQVFFRPSGPRRTPIDKHDLPAILAALRAGELWDATADADGPATYLSLEHYRPQGGGSDPRPLGAKR